MNVQLQYTSEMTGRERVETYDAAMFRRIISAGYHHFRMLEKEEGATFPRTDREAMGLALQLQHEIKA